MKYTSYLRNRKQGTRRLLYEGTSKAKAIGLLYTAMEVLGEFKLTATVVVYDEKGKTCYERDFIDGNGFVGGMISEMLGLPR